MAKLNARGRTCLAEVSREYTEAQLQKAHGRYTASYNGASELSLTTWERTTKRLMSDGKILEKRDVLFRRSQFETRDHRHSYGWKVAAQLKPGKTTADFIAVYTGPRKDGSPSQWTVNSGAQGQRTTVLSLKRVMRAVESGESIGFCTACGADQLGVEPDANGYTCESCRQPAVSGAENLLMEMSS